MRDRLAAIPGVTAVSFSDAAPLEDGAERNHLRRKHDFGRVRPRTNSAPQARGARVPRRRSARRSWRAATSHGTTSISIGRSRWCPRILRESTGRRPQPLSASACAKIRRPPGARSSASSADIHDDGMQRPAPAIVYWPVLMENFWGNRINVPRGVTFAIRSNRDRQRQFSGRDPTGNLGGQRQRAGRAGPHAG